METLYNYQNQLIASTEFSFRRLVIDTIEWNERLVGLLGPRGVGKTTCLLQRLMDEPYPDQTRLYVSLDNLANPYPTLLALAETFYRQGGKLLILDEIHKYPGWAAEIKNIYDLYPELRVVFSGSSILKLMYQGVDLSRRAVIYYLHGLSFREFLQIQTGKKFPSCDLDKILKDHVSVALSIVKEIKPLQYFPDYLTWGYYPFFLQGTSTYPLKLQAIINYILETEIPAISNLDIRNIQKIKRALQIIAEHVPYQPNITKLSSSLELNRNTLLQYLVFLEQTGIITSLYHTGSFYGKLTKPGKILLHHPNHSFTLSSGEVNKGSIREGFFVNQLSVGHKVEMAMKGDFLIDERYTFEIGGKGKTRKQIVTASPGYLVSDDIEVGFKNKIPLWLFGFLY
ncbi:MAG: ATP-binding protein [Bacteroidales bacterium]|nr:ATP-binding protein [Bacteroidales bacterium]